MTRRSIRLLALLLAGVPATARAQSQPGRRRRRAPARRTPPNTDMHYQLGPDSLPREGVPKGELRGPFVLPSQAYPGHAAHLLGLRAGAVRRRRCRPA